MSPSPQDDYLERIKAEIRADAALAREREPLPRLEPLPRVVQAAALAPSEPIERDRLDYAIGELTGADYRAFLDRAFRVLLKRSPDDVGIAVQTRLLAAGASKAEILGNLRWSPEGRVVGTRVRGLLPRYALAKLARVPVLGYFVDWGVALAGLPLLLRHQRAADTSVAARFGAASDAQRNTERGLDELRASHASLSAEHDRRGDAMRADISRMLLRLDELEHRAHALELRTEGLENRAAELERRADRGAHEMIELRHYTHTANHWIASLQDGIGELEDHAAAERERADALAASIDAGAAETSARATRYAAWAAAFAARLPAAARVLDLGSGDGAWVTALAAHGVASSGIEENAALVARAQECDLAVTLGDPIDALTRCVDADFDALGIGASALGRNAAAMARWLDEARRVLKPGALLLLRCECEPYRLEPLAAPADAAQHAGNLLAAAGFTLLVTLPAQDAAAVLAQRPA